MSETCEKCGDVMSPDDTGHVVCHKCGPALTTWVEPESQTLEELKAALRAKFKKRKED